MRVRRRGMTLVEVMVVSAIIATLLAIVAPALHRARISALQTDDVSRLRQLAVAQGLYIEEYGIAPVRAWEIELSGLAPSNLMASPLDPTPEGYSNRIAYRSERLEAPFRCSIVGIGDWGWSHANLLVDGDGYNDLGAFVVLSEYEGRLCDEGEPMGCRGRYHRLTLDGAVRKKSHQVWSYEGGEIWSPLALFADIDAYWFGRNERRNANR